VAGFDREQVERILRERAAGLGRLRTGPESQDPVSEEQDRPPPADPQAGCVDCGRPIAPRRLEAVPHAVRCVGCQLRHEAL
jgi:Prokaryotic dksA/traR C4-type zinc finger